ncbi:porphobilinogen deaminase [Hymenopellis radicata]|nr:porphobilinogen deaminase [Hymenopellis radicata]
MSSTESKSRSYVLASRGSVLAKVQTNSVLAALQALYPDGDDSAPSFSSSFMQSGGDVNKTTALFLIGGKALWTKELEVALKEHVCDFLVHSFKDVPTILPEGCMIGAVMERVDPADSLIIKKSKEGVWKTLDDLPAGSVVGTGSIRRIAQLKRKYPNLQFQDCRGNIDTRLAKLDAEDGPYAAIILAKAGLVRLNATHRIAVDLTPPVLFHAVSQGALAVEIRTDDPEALRLCQTITHKPSHIRCFAERACLRVLEGGCSVPVGVDSSYEDGVLNLTGCVTSLEGTKHVEYSLKEKVDTIEESEEVGTAMARKLIDMGAKKILEEISVDKMKRAKEAEKIEQAAAAAATS